MKCTHCGRELLGSGTTCLYCGHEVKLLGTGQTNSTVASSRQSTKNRSALLAALLAVFILGGLGFLFRDTLSGLLGNDTAAPSTNQELSAPLEQALSEPESNPISSDIPASDEDSSSNMPNHSDEEDSSDNDSSDNSVSDTKASEKTNPDQSDLKQPILWANDYILPYSDSMYYTAEDLESLSADDLRYARNEIYARHGRKFQDSQLQSYFNACSWYHGTIEPENFQEQSLNEYEMANRDLIKQCENGQQITSASGTQGSSSSSASTAEIIVGIWHNGYTDWSSNYHTIFYEDGTAEHFGYRNYDIGIWEPDTYNHNTIVAYYDQYQDVPGEGYVYSGSYTCYYYYNSSSGYLERNIYPGDYYDDFTNDGDGLLQKVPALVDVSY